MSGDKDFELNEERMHEGKNLEIKSTGEIIENQEGIRLFKAKSRFYMDKEYVWAEIWEVPIDEFKSLANNLGLSEKNTFKLYSNGKFEAFKNLINQERIKKINQ